VSTNFSEVLVQVRRPPWLKVQATWGEDYRKVKSLLAKSNLHTVCQEANCPNMCHCFERGTATFMILGDVCTRGCGFCNVKRGQPLPLDEDEPRRVAEAVGKLRLQYAVITSVTRDDLEDGGASVFARTIDEIRRLSPSCKVEVLIPDFGGSPESLRTVIDAQPDVLNHNLETVERLYPEVRKGADYQRSLKLLRNVKKIDRTMVSKSGMMLGLGENRDEIVGLMRDLRSVDCNLLTIGQYLSPSDEHVPIARFYHPDEFAELKSTGERMGFAHVESGPLVRSSYHAKEQVKYLKTYVEV
jgi:lipoic acid synthetase